MAAVEAHFYWPYRKLRNRVSDEMQGRSLEMDSGSRSGNRTRGMDGKPLRAIGTHTDIGERKLAMEALRRQNAVMSQFNAHGGGAGTAHGATQAGGQRAVRPSGLAAAPPCCCPVVATWGRRLMGTPAGSIESASDAVFDREASYRRYLEALLDGDRNAAPVLTSAWLAAHAGLGEEGGGAGRLRGLGAPRAI